METVIKSITNKAKKLWKRIRFDVNICMARRMCHLTSIGNPIVDIRRSCDRLISTTVFLYWYRNLDRHGKCRISLAFAHRQLCIAGRCLVPPPPHLKQIFIKPYKLYVKSIFSFCFTDRIVCLGTMLSQITSLTIVYRLQVQIKENIKAPRHWPLWGNSTGHRWIPRTKGQ